MRAIKIRDATLPKIFATTLLGDSAGIPPQKRRFQAIASKIRLVKIGDGGFDNLAGPLGRDAVTAGHILQLATPAGGADVYFTF